MCCDAVFNKNIRCQNIGELKNHIGKENVIYNKHYKEEEVDDYSCLCCIDAEEISKKINMTLTTDYMDWFFDGKQ